MKPNQERIEALFEAARHLASRAEQAAYLDRACGDDAELRRQIEAMLDAEGAADLYFRTADVPGEAVRDAALKQTPTASAEPLTEGPGTIIGRYKLLQQIGEGGFGVVYMAEQQEPVRRKVALKIIKLGMDTKQVVARFEAERQALALMDHPHIAKVLDAGVTGERSEVRGQRSEVGSDGFLTSDLRPLTSGSGRPYFVMELVHGIPITAYCDKHNLSPAERLGLLLPVCQAIQHAHQKGIIHRDIKPSNVLVTLNDGVPHPMVIDFGVAKALNQRLTERTLYTEFGQMIGTPAYMSPEQAEMSKLDVDTRSDIYSLGVLLYELLTGTTPFPEQRLRRAGWAEMQRIITEEEPERPSTRLNALTQAERTGVAQHRQTDARKLTLLVRGELDWIVMKCLEKDRTRRYETANGLAMDIQRYLHDEPVLAVAPSARYRMMKFARRHRAGLAVTAALFGMLVAGVLVSSWQMMRARQAEQGAVAARGQAEAVSEFLVEAFRSPDPERDGRKVTVAEVLDQATTNLMGRFDDAPERKAALLDALGQTYLGLGLYPEAQGLLQRSFELRRRVLGRAHPDTLQSMLHLSNSQFWPDLPNGAEPIARECLALHQRVWGIQHTNTLAAMDRLANVLEAKQEYAEAEALLTDSLRMRRQAGANESAGTLECQSDLASLYAKQDRLREAEALHLDTLRTIRRVLSPRHPLLLATLNNLGFLYKEKEAAPAQAEPLFREALEASHQILGPDHPTTVILTHNLGAACRALGRLTEAEPLYEQALEKMRRPSWPEHRIKFTAMHSLSDVYHNLGRSPQAEKLFQEILEAQRQVFGPEHRETLITMQNLALAYSRQNRLDDAQKLFAQTLELERRVLGEEDRLTLKTRNNLALVQARQRQLALAEKSLRETFEICRRQFGPEDSLTLTTRLQLGQVLSRQGRPAEAESMMEEILRLRRRALGPDDPDTLDALLNLAQVNEQLNRLERAEALFRELLETSRRRWGPEDERTRSALSDLGSLYAMKLKRPAEAEPLFREALEISRRLRGIDHEETLRLMNNVGFACLRLKRLPEAEALLRETLEIERRVLGNGHALTLVTLENLASVDTNQGEIGQAVARHLELLQHRATNAFAYTRALDFIDRNSSHPDHPKFLARFADTCAELFAQHPEVADDLSTGLRCFAARLAARAAASPDSPATAVNDPAQARSATGPERARLRRLAFDWLRADLAVGAAQLDPSAPLSALRIEDALRRWQESTDLASLREPPLVQILSDGERQTCTKLWAEVAALRQAAGRLKDTAFVTLLPMASRWVYWHDAADPGPTWREPDFADATWKRGPGPLGYGDTGLATTIAPGSDNPKRPLTVYFRSKFLHSPPGSDLRLVLRLRCDDGAALYLNAQEILRDNLPASGALASDTPALRPVGGDAETTYFIHEPTAASASLRPGTNTVAVEVHQSEPTSSDLAFDLEILALRKK